MTIEPLTASQLTTIRRTVGPIQSMILHLGDVDLSRGAGVLGPRTKCLWTKDRRRITFEVLPGGGFIGSIGNGPDPECPEVPRDDR